MEEQLELQLSSHRKSESFQYNIFLGVFPDPTTAKDLVERAETLRGIHRLTGKLRPIRHLHVTLHLVSKQPRVPPGLAVVMDRICAPLAARTPIFEVTFDRALSFQVKRPDRPLVLIGSATANAPLRNLRRKLEEVLNGANVPGGSHYTPHVTLLYDRHSLPEEPIEPVNWQVQEIVLVGSLAGATKYERLASWPLKGAGL